MHVNKIVSSSVVILLITVLFAGAVTVPAAAQPIGTIGTNLTVSFSTAYANGQNFTIIGTLNDTNGNPIAGATIQLQQNVSGTWTDLSGKTNTTQSDGSYAISTGEQAVASSYEYRTTFAGNATYASATSNAVGIVTAPTTSTSTSSSTSTSNTSTTSTSTLAVTTDKPSYNVGDTITFSVTVPASNQTIPWTDTPPSAITMAATSGSLPASSSPQTFKITAAANTPGTGLQNKLTAATVSTQVTTQVTTNVTTQVTSEFVPVTVGCFTLGYVDVVNTNTNTNTNTDTGTGTATFNIAAPTSASVKLDVFPTLILPKTNEIIAVTIESNKTTGFNPSTVIPSTVRFGHSGTEASPLAGSITWHDDNHDGIKDLTLLFWAKDTKLLPTDTHAILTGKTTAGTSIQGTVKVLVIH